MTDGRKRPPAPRDLTLVSLPLLVALWQGAAFAAQSRFLPAPLQVAQRVADLVQTGPMVADFAQTLGRAAAGFGLSMVLGCAIGLVLGRFGRADQLFGSWLIVGLNLPAIIVAFLCFIWLGLTDVALVLAVVVNKTPLVATAIRQGMRSLLPEYDEFAAAYRLTLMRRARLVLWPQLAPFVMTAARTGLSLVWKIVLVFEMLGASGGVGFRVALYFQLFDITAILAYTAVFVGLVLVLEHAILIPLERRASAWRSAPI